MHIIDLYYQHRVDPDVPIPGTTKLHRLEENFGSVDIELTPDDLHQIDDYASRITIQGNRYNVAGEKMTGLLVNWFVLLQCH